MKRLAWGMIAGLCLAAAPAVAADDGPVTYFKDILPIIQENCQECHRQSGANLSGMVAPMPFTGYAEVRPWAKAIAREVEAGNMPPWYASDEFAGVFELERRLSDEQIQAIIKWAKTGAQRGNPADAPEPKEFKSPEGWTLGEPDLVLPIPEPYWVADEIEDIQPSFSHVLTEEELPEDKWINWIEFRPGSEVVHHGGARVQPLGPDGKPVVDPICGGKIIGTAPGDGPDLWPEGYGKLIRKGSQITFGLHYHKEPGPGTGVWDRSMIAIKWHDKPVQYVVRAAGISSRGWEVPPQHNFWEVGAARTFEEDTFIINMMPHMHWRGRAAKYVAVYPSGKRETLLDVPNYNFDWQLTYTYKEPKFLPAGTRLEVSMWFDNSDENHWVPNPNRPVGFGSMTQDEMNIGWTEYANAQPIEDILNHDFGDQGTGVEDIDLD